MKFNSFIIREGKIPSSPNYLISTKMPDDEKLKAKVYIDGANIFYTQKKLEWNLNWAKVKNYIENDKIIIEWRYYIGIKDTDEKMRGYLKYLGAIGFNTITKMLKKIKLDGGDTIIEMHNSKFIYKANFDVEITTDILLDKSKVDEIILFSGDSDFRYLVRRLKDLGMRITICASRKTISWELKLEADKIVYLEDIKSEILRE